MKKGKKSKKKFESLPENELEQAAGGGIAFGFSFGWSYGCAPRVCAPVIAAPVAVTVGGTRARAPGLGGYGPRDGRAVVPVGTGAPVVAAPAAPAPGGGIVVNSAPLKLAF
jgi:hypothetical protein